MAFEWRFRVDTGRPVTLEEIEHHGAGGYFDYVATDWLTLRRGLSYLEVGPDDVFVDLGSGKGRAVLVAALYPFKRVIGVELSPSLHAIAQANVQRNLDRLRAKEVELIMGDATEYQPPDDLSVVFLSNPYAAEPFKRTIGTLLASLERNPRTLRILYFAPYEETALLSTGRVRKIKHWRSHLMALYEMTS